MKIEDYALIGDTHTAALVGLDGSIDWLCLPRFDSGACFAALLGRRDNGHWRIGPVGAPKATWRRYIPATLILETEHETATGAVRVTDFMPIRDSDNPYVVRIVEGLSGTVEMAFDLVLRFDYGLQVPWVRSVDGGIHAVAGPNAIDLTSPVPLHGRHMHTEARFEVRAGERLPFVLGWYLSYQQPPDRVDALMAQVATEKWWVEWCGYAGDIRGDFEDLVLRSLITLKALTYAPSGGIVAAPTTSLPEDLGGVRNWDYRYCWVRDATLTLDAIIESGCRMEAESWMRWLTRAAAGNPEQLQIMYGVAGERLLPEVELDWLAGYERSKPVRVGNAASNQFQLDVYGELMDATDRGRRHGLPEHPETWKIQVALLDFVAEHWSEPDDGIWEVRGPRRPFVHSRVMAWVAMDRGVKAVEEFGLKGDLELWKEARDSIHEEVLAQGWNENRGAFTQYYGCDLLDASVLMMPIVGFLPADDPRVVSTVEAVERELIVDGFVSRYQNESGVDGLPGNEGTFLPCSFWLVDCLAMMGRTEDARRLFERVAGVANDVGLLAEEYDTKRRRMVGNFPQAFSHVGLVNSARNLALAGRSGERP